MSGNLVYTIEALQFITYNSLQFELRHFMKHLLALPTMMACIHSAKYKCCVLRTKAVVKSHDAAQTSRHRNTSNSLDLILRGFICLLCFVLKLHTLKLLLLPKFL